VLEDTGFAFDVETEGSDADVPDAADVADATDVDDVDDTEEGDDKPLA
jgi:hypothetical protein